MYILIYSNSKLLFTSIYHRSPHTIHGIISHGRRWPDGFNDFHGWKICDFYRFFFPACQVRVVRFYVSCRASSSSSPLLLLLLLLLLLVAGPQPRPSTPSVHCRTSTTTSHAQCSLPDLNHAHPRPVFAAGPQPRPSTPSVRCRTSTTTIHAQCSLPDLNSYAKRYGR